MRLQESMMRWWRQGGLVAIDGGSGAYRMTPRRTPKNVATTKMSSGLTEKLRVG